MGKIRDEVNDGGAVFFGLVLGWITHSTFHSNSQHGVQELAAILGVIGGATVSKLFSKTETQFAMYCVGLACGFFIHVAIARWC